MHYTLHQKSFTDEILNASIGEFILIQGNNFIRVYDREMNVIAERKYNCRIYQAEWVNNQIVVLIEICRIEVLELQTYTHHLKNLKLIYGFKVVCLRYYEQANLHAHKYNVYTPHDIYDAPCHVITHPRFIKNKDCLLLRISRTHMALIMHESTIYNLVGTGLEGFTSFCFVPNFPLPTALFVCEKIKLFTIQTMMKIDEFYVDGVYNALTLKNGICLQKNDRFLISHSKTYKNFYEVLLSGNAVAFNDDIFVCNNIINRIIVVFIYGRVKECIIEKIIDRKFNWMRIGDKLCFLGNENDDCEILEYKIVNSFQENCTENKLKIIEPEETSVCNIYGESENIEIEPKDRSMIALYDDTVVENIASKFEYKYKCTLKNYSIKSLKRYMNQLICVGYNKLVILSDLIEMNLQFIMKIRGFNRFFKVGKIFCMTNQRESYFVSVDNKEINGYITDKETLEYTMIDRRILQITKEGIYENGTDLILNEISGIKNVCFSHKTLYLLDETKCLWIVQNFVVKKKIFNVDLFCVDKVLWVLNGNQLLCFDTKLIFDCLVDNCDVIYNKCTDQSNFIDKDENIELSNAAPCRFLEIVLLKNILFFRTAANVYSYQVTNQFLKLIVIDLPPISFTGFVKINDKLLIRPDVLIYHKDEWNVQRISHRIVHMTDKYVLTRNTLSRYKFGPSFKNKYKIPDFKGEFIDCNDVLIIGGYSKLTFYQHSIKMLSCNLLKPENYGTQIKNFILDEYIFNEDEFITDLKFLKLNDNIRSERVSRKYFSSYLVILSSAIQGYKDLTRGRIIVFEIADVQTSEVNKKTKKMRALADHKVASNLMSCTEIRGNIAVCQGTRIMLYKFDRLDGLTAIAFHDMHLATTSIASIKNYLIAGDILRGISFFFYQYKPVKMHKISTSENITGLSHVMVLSYHTRQKKSEALFVAFDDTNVHLYTYSPTNVLSKNGENLIKRGLMYLNDQIIGSDDDIFYSTNSLYRIKQAICSDSEVKILSLTAQKSSIGGVLKPITVKDLINIDDIRKMCKKDEHKLERFCEDVKWY